MPIPNWASMMARIAQGGIAGAATPNVAFGGPTDVFRAMQGGGDKIAMQDLAMYNRRRQGMEDLAQADLHRAQADYYRARPGIEGDKTQFNREKLNANQQTALEKLAAQKAQNDARLAVAKDANEISRLRVENQRISDEAQNIIRAAAIGYDFQPGEQPQSQPVSPAPAPAIANPPGGNQGPSGLTDFSSNPFKAMPRIESESPAQPASRVPMMTPRKREDLSPKQQADLTLSEARTENTQARTNATNTPKPPSTMSAAALAAFRQANGREPTVAEVAQIARQTERPAAAASPGKASDAKEIAAAIVEGRRKPTLSGLYGMTASVSAELARAKTPDGKPYDHATAERDWTAIQKHLATLNGAQQERLRQAITFTYDSIPIIEDLYKQWQATGLPGGFKTWNKAALIAASHAPGKSGSIANNLLSQISDFTSEMGTVYKGGNSSTDESLKLAASNLMADWNDQTFKDALARARQNLQIRKNSIQTSEPAGVSPTSPYLPNRGQQPSGNKVEDLRKKYQY